MATAGQPPPVELPTSDDRTMAVLAHALQMVGGFIAPLVILILRRERRFVAFHALQALLLQVCFLLAWFGVFAIMMVTIFATAVPAAAGHQAEPPWAFFLVLPLFWLLAMGGWMTVLVISIVYALKAGRGEWARYPVLGRLSRRFLNLDGAAS